MRAATAAGGDQPEAVSDRANDPAVLKLAADRSERARPPACEVRLSSIVAPSPRVRVVKWTGPGEGPGVTGKATY